MSGERCGRQSRRARVGAARFHSGHLVAALAMSLLLAPAAARADTFTVVAGDATSLQTALNDAAAHVNAAGPDVVSVPSGVYNGSFSYAGDPVDVEGAGQTTTTLTTTGTTTLEIDAPASAVSGLNIANTSSTYGFGLDLPQGGTVRDVELDPSGTNVIGLRSNGDTSVARARIVVSSTSTGVRASGGAMTISETTVDGAAGSSRGVVADSVGTTANVAGLRSLGVSFPLRAAFGGTLTVRDSLLVLPTGVSSTALEAGDSNNPSNFTATLNADRVTIVGDPATSQRGAFLYANSAGDDFAVDIHDSVISGVANPLGCYSIAGTGQTSADWSSLPATGDSSSGAGCATTRTNVVAGAPTFVDASGGDYHQRHDSPLIDAGDPAPFAPTEDLDGLARPVGRVDLGAYEYQRRPPLVSASATPAAAATTQDVTFTATASDPDPGDSLLTYAWSFDDGGTAIGPSANHAFASAGAHTGTVTVKDPSGLTAGAAATVTVTAPSSRPAPDLTTPRVTLLVKRRLSLAKALRRGIPATIGCSEACSYNATLLLDARTAKRLQLAGRVTVGKRSTALSAAGTRKLTIKFSRRARRALRHHGPLEIRVRASATDRSGNTGRARTGKTTLRR
jgi:hypothetical protein